MAHFHGNVSAKHVHTDGSWSVAPTIGTVTPAATGVTFTHSGGGTHYRIYPLAGSPGAWVSLGASPVTVSGLTANTEYVLELSGNGSTVADTENFGTTNPGSGGGEVPLDVLVTISGGGSHAAAFAASVSVEAGAVVVSVTVAMTGAHAATFAASVAISDGGADVAYPLAGLTQPYPLAGLTQS